MFRLALSQLPELPTGCYLAVNVSPATLVDGRFRDLLATAPSGQLVVEVTEHARVQDYDLLRRSRRWLRDRDARLAIDDVGTGFSGLDHILQFEPDLLKIDGALVRDIDLVRGKQTMVAGLVTFADQVGTTVIAEQVETTAELDRLRKLGVTHAQGYLLGHPEPLRWAGRRRSVAFVSPQSWT